MPPSTISAVVVSPEQARNAKHASPASDQYAVGVMLYECATGRQPFSGNSAYEILHAIVTTTPPRACELNPNVPVEFAQIIERAMQRDPAKRYPSMKALGSALLAFGGRRTWTIWGREFTGGIENAGAADRTARELRPVQHQALSPSKRARALALAGVVLGVALGYGGALLVPARAGQSQIARALVAAPLVRQTPAQNKQGANTPRADARRVDPPGAPTPEAVPATLGTPSPAKRETEAKARRPAARVAGSPRSSSARSKASRPADIAYEVGANGVPILE